MATGTGPPPTISSPERPGNPGFHQSPAPTVTAPKLPSGTPTGPGIGLYFVGALVVVSMADTKVAPVVVAFLAAAAIYNANYLLTRYQAKN